MPRAWLPNPDPGTSVCVGFDGSDSDDWTAIRCETRDGYLFTPRYGPDRRPSIWNPAEWNGRIPRREVHAAVDHIFSTWRVERLYTDPPDWQSEIGDWAARYGEDHVFEWATYRPRPMHEALTRFVTDVSTQRLTHDGCLLTEIAMRNARKVAAAGNRYLLGKPSQTQKIDPAMASVLAHEAAADAREAGWDLVDSGISTAMYGFN